MTGNNKQLSNPSVTCGDSSLYTREPFGVRSQHGLKSRDGRTHTREPLGMRIGEPPIRKGAGWSGLPPSGGEIGGLLVLFHDSYLYIHPCAAVDLAAQAAFFNVFGVIDTPGRGQLAK